MYPGSGRDLSRLSIPGRSPYGGNWTGPDGGRKTVESSQSNVAKELSSGGGDVVMSHVTLSDDGPKTFPKIPPSGNINNRRMTQIGRRRISCEYFDVAPSIDFIYLTSFTLYQSLLRRITSK